MKQPEDIVIKDFQKGIADSPYLGFQELHGLDITTVPGGVRTNLEPGDGASAVTGLVKWIVDRPGVAQTGSEDFLYALDDAGVVYGYDTSNGWAVISGNTTNADAPAGQGLIVWHNYLFVARSTKIDVYGPLDSSPSWTNDWKTNLDTDTRWHPMITGQDDILYIGAGRYVASLQDLSTFVPGTGATFTWTPQALDLPKNYRIKCIAELGAKLMLGTIQGGTNDLSGEVNNLADIFPWDPTQSTFELPIRLSDNGIHQMKNINNQLWITAGKRGSVYISNGSTTRLVRTLPFPVTGVEKNAFLNFFPGACAVHNGKYYFGVSQGTTGTSYPAVGIWSCSSTGVLNYEYQMGTGTVASANPLYIGSLISLGFEKLYWGFRDNAADANGCGIDSLSSNGYTDYKAFFISPFYQIGTALNPRQLSILDFSLDRPLVSGEGLRFSYRTALNAAFTTFATIDFATYAGVQVFSIAAPVSAAVQIQFKVEFDEAGTDRFVLNDIRLR